MRSATVADLESLVRSRRELLDDGWTQRGLRHAVDSGRLRMLRRGWFIDAAADRELWGESKHRAHVVAVHRNGRDRGVVSHESAAVLWGLPLYRHTPRRVHLTFAEERISSSPDVFRHVASLDDDDIVERDGIRCTGLARTVFDASRTLPTEAAVVVADAAERMLALPGRQWDAGAAARWREQLYARIDAAAGARGIRRARWVAAFADGRAQLPGESVSRLQLHRLGFAPPRLQVPLGAPGGGSYFADFALDDVGVFGEFDGRGKYLDESMRRGIPLEQVLLDEKTREDWIRGTTGRAVVRWGDEHIATPAALGARLAAFSIRPPR